MSCNGCTACCRNDRIVVDPRNDDVSAYRWHWNQKYGSPGVDMVLDRKPDGSCIYLTDAGCGIHGRAPAVCKAFDCRTVVSTTTPEWRAMRIAQNPSLEAVYASGFRRLSHTSAATACPMTAAEYSQVTALTAKVVKEASSEFMRRSSSSAKSSESHVWRFGALR